MQRFFPIPFSLSNFEDEFGSSFQHYHTRRYGTEDDLSYELGEHRPVSQLVEFHGDWVQETYHAVSEATSVNQFVSIGFPPDLRRHTVSFQLQDTITLHFLHNLEITPMGRLQRLTGLTIGSILTPFNPPTGNIGWKPTGSIALKERFGHGWQAFATYGKYIRYPNLYEIYGDGIFVAPHVDSTGQTPYLSAEIGRTVDFGIGWDGNLAEKLSGHARLTFFHRQTDNAITLYQSPIISTYFNSGNTINRGIDLEGSLHRGNFASLQTAVTVQDGWYKDQGFYEWGASTPVYPGSEKIPTLNSPYGTGDARLDLHFLRGGDLTTFFETKYVGQNVIGITPTTIFQPNGGYSNRYDGLDVYERPLTTIDLGIHLKLPRGGTFSSGVTDLLNRGPNQMYGGYQAPFFSGLSNVLTWYTCSTTGTKYSSPPTASQCPAQDVITDQATVPVISNVWYPQQGRTVYVLMSWDFNGWRPRTK